MCHHLLDEPRFRAAALAIEILDRIAHLAPHTRPEFRALLAGGVAADLVRGDIDPTDNAVRNAVRNYQVRWPAAFVSRGGR